MLLFGSSIYLENTHTTTELKKKYIEWKENNLFLIISI